MIRSHVENKAAVSIAALPVAEAEARSCGIMRIESSGRVIDFEEKPKTRELLDRVRTDPDWMARFGIEAKGRPYLASMGIYLFNRSTLVDLLASGDAVDFGKEIFPQAIAGHRVQAHLFDGYWEDIGTVGAFHKANIDLTRDNPPFDFTFGDSPIYTRPRYLPCSRISGADRDRQPDLRRLRDRQELGDREFGDRRPCPDRRGRRRSAIPTSWAPIATRAPSKSPPTSGRTGPDIGIGAGSVIENAIVDKNARIGKNVRILNEAGIVESEESSHFVIRDKIVVIPKFTIIPDGLVI